MIRVKGDPEAAGCIPHWLSTESDEGAVEQIHLNYGHGGGWQDFEGFTMAKDGSDDLLYRGDPPTRKLAEMEVGNERVIVYEYGWVAVVQPDRSFRVARID